MRRNPPRAADIDPQTPLMRASFAALIERLNLPGGLIESRILSATDRSHARVEDVPASQARSVYRALLDLDRELAAEIPL